MKSIISPWLIYFASRADNLVTFFWSDRRNMRIYCYRCFYFAGLAGYNEPLSLEKLLQINLSDVL